jgi:predicted NBD/HSP70 family sugar kinase
LEGRPTELLALAADRYYVLGLDVGGLSQQAVVANLRGEVVGSVATARPLSTGRAGIIDHIARLVDHVLAGAHVAHEQVLGLGIGLRAVVDPISGVITGGPETPAWSPAWIDFAIRDELARVLPWQRIAVDDTVRALGIAEGRYGAAMGEPDFAYPLADSGIGAAIMIGGRPYIGPGHIAGEVGHITLDPEGEPCACGKAGCLETLASSSAILARARALPGCEQIELDALFTAAEAGDPNARSLLQEGGVALGRGIAVVVNLLAPRLIVVGGAMTGSALYLAAATETARTQVLGRIGRTWRIVHGQLGPLAGASGAGTMILDTLFDPAGAAHGRRPGELTTGLDRSQGGADQDG